ncbi:MAG: hypothetical protein WGN25_04885 [Candidatus Electrothrix sp. GW3-4]|uniref:hypothetical protein n=1 Tax=Candidatus Electrothrix sp. GW3-4 TaxID=3126740 RepID=UPI0030CE91BD
MPAYQQQLHAFEKSIKIIEELAQSDSSAIAEKSIQTLNKTYETLIEIFALSEEPIPTVA